MHYACKMKVLLFQNSRPFGGSEQGARGWCVRRNGNEITRRQKGEANSESTSQEGEGASLDTAQSSRVADNNFIKGGEYATPMGEHEERLTTILAAIAAWTWVLEFHS
jgi:hypothetical protein